MKTHRSPLEVADWIVRCTEVESVHVCGECPYRGLRNGSCDCATLLAIDAAELIRAAYGKEKSASSGANAESGMDKIDTPIIGEKGQ